LQWKSFCGGVRHKRLERKAGKTLIEITGVLLIKKLEKHNILRRGFFVDRIWVAE
jgi:hypothetical protein